MPARTNEFQQMVTAIYSQIVPAGGHVTESAMLRENGTGAEREVDVLIEHNVAGHAIKIAVECRDHGRDQNLAWIDGLIGKYSRLKVNQIVAVSSSPFSQSAKAKAAQHNIEAITVNEALTADWIDRIQQWKGMQHSFTLMSITTLDADGKVLTFSEVSADGAKATHRDQESEYMYNAVQPFFMQQLSASVAKSLEDKIAENWQGFIDDPTPRWAEIVVTKPGITRHGKDMGIEKLVFGIGTHFHIGRPGNHLAVKHHAMSEMKIPTFKGESSFTMITDSQGNVLSFGVKDEKKA
jgi:hypothetical protein